MGALLLAPTWAGINFGFSSTVPVDGLAANVSTSMSPIKRASSEFAFPGVDGSFQRLLGRRYREIIWDMDLLFLNETNQKAWEDLIEPYVLNGEYTMVLKQRTYPYVSLFSFEPVGKWETVYESPHIIGISLFQRYRLTYRDMAP